jgi:hypothetical protein
VNTRRLALCACLASGCIGEVLELHLQPPGGPQLDGGATVMPEPDASVPDAGQPVVDAGPTDAPDAGPAVDAGRPDAGPALDAGLPDLETPGVFVAVGDHLHHLRSFDDGATWQDEASVLPASGTGDLYGVRGISWGDRFVAFAAKVLTSPNAAVGSWTEVKDDGQWLGSIVYAQNQWVSAGGYGWLATSTDLVNWVQHPPVANYTVAHHGTQVLVFGAGHYVVSNDEGTVYHSSDAHTWTHATGVPAVSPMQAISFTYGNGVFVGVLPSGVDVIRSDDGGASWTSAGPPLAHAAAAPVFGHGHFSLFADGHVYTSTDGSAWVDHVAPTSRRSNAFVYGHGTYLSLSWPGKFRRSTDDGLTWVDGMTTPMSDAPAALAFGHPP